MNSAGTGVITELLRSLDGLRNRKAIALLMSGFVLAMLLVGGGTRIGFDSVVFGATIVIVGVLCGLFGISAAGIVLMDVTRGRAESSYGDAILLGTVAFLKLVIGVIGLGLALAGVHIAIAAVLYVCKIPGVGPLLFALLLPFMLLAMALVYLGAGACFSLLAPALWDGNTLGAAFARVYAISSNRPIQFIIAWLAASVLLGFVLAVLVGVLLGATGGVGTMSAVIIGSDVSSFGADVFSNYGGASGLGRSPWGQRGGGDASGYLLAGMFGVSFAWVIMFAAFGAVALMGMCIIYVGLIEGLDTKQAEQYLADRISQAKQKAAEVQELAKQHAQAAQARARDAATQRAVAAAAPAAGEVPTLRCSGCGEPFDEGQMFCAECGNKVGGA